LGNVPAAQQPGLLRIRSEDLRANVYFLASDALQGRMSLQPGDEAAVRWIAANSPSQDWSLRQKIRPAMPPLCKRYR